MPRWSRPITLRIVAYIDPVRSSCTYITQCDQFSRTPIHTTKDLHTCTYRHRSTQNHELSTLASVHQVHDPTGSANSIKRPDSSRCERRSVRCLTATGLTNQAPTASEDQPAGLINQAHPHPDGATADTHQPPESRHQPIQVCSAPSRMSILGRSFAHCPVYPTIGPPVIPATSPPVLNSTSPTTTLPLGKPAHTAHERD